MATGRERYRNRPNSTFTIAAKRLDPHNEHPMEKNPFLGD
jgi:hypothetical protein